MEDSSSLFFEAKKLLRNDRCVDAKIILEIITKKEPDNLDYLLELAKAYSYSDDFGAAIPVLENIIKIKPDIESASFILFICYFNEKKLDLAADELLRFISKYPSLHYRECIKDLLTKKMPIQTKPRSSE